MEMGSTLGHRNGTGEHGRRRRDYYTLFAFDFLRPRFCGLLPFIGSFHFSFSHSLSHSQSFSLCGHLSHIYLAPLIKLCAVAFFSSLFFSSFHFRSFPSRFRRV
ncbi:unnamed protein product [Tuber melanosporum]|uniref:(Perigord truffle) hypothetical protein n=1 Tax=Tuber melanosporum (strain Mel28) TaxID=656061 RepID=D5GD33_TUBMM|nr:uncharacterized protein GSTUM_00000947001 [Tuber melanosporum]CAZ82426.1 unnamed protein product [Tuber melanosporum]